jgi:hypothetical protein
MYIYKIMIFPEDGISGETSKKRRGDGRIILRLIIGEEIVKMNVAAPV